MVEVTLLGSAAMALPPLSLTFMVVVLLMLSVFVKGFGTGRDNSLFVSRQADWRLCVLCRL
jgi:hypothetical protein